MRKLKIWGENYKKTLPRFPLVATVPYIPVTGTPRSNPLLTQVCRSRGGPETNPREETRSPPAPLPLLCPPPQAAGNFSPGLGEHLALCPPDGRRRAPLAVTERRRHQRGRVAGSSRAEPGRAKRPLPGT